MAFYMKPGRGPMMKTGQGIPQTFQSPEKQAGAILQKQQDEKDGTTFTVNDDTGATLSSTNSTTTPSKTREKTNFSTDATKRAKQKKWIKDNPEAYKKALDAKKKKPVTKTSTATESDNTSLNTMKSEGKSDLQAEIGKYNMKNFKSEMSAKNDSIATHKKVFMDLTRANATENVHPATIRRHAEIAGNESANATRNQLNIPEVQRTTGTHDQLRGSIKKGKAEIPGLSSSKESTFYLPNELSKYKRKGKLYMDIPK